MKKRAIVEFDDYVDCLYVRLSNKKSARTEEVANPMVLIDYSRSGEIIGIEIHYEGKKPPAPEGSNGD